jgi:hypothetical protein
MPSNVDPESVNDLIRLAAKIGSIPPNDLSDDDEIPIAEMIENGDGIPVGVALNDALPAGDDVIYATKRSKKLDRASKRVLGIEPADVVMGEAGQGRRSSSASDDYDFLGDGEGLSASLEADLNYFDTPEDEDVVMMGRGGGEVGESGEEIGRGMTRSRKDDSEYHRNFNK